MRTWPGLGALGAGLIHLGSAAGTTPLVLIPLALIGAAEVVWGVATLARPTPLRPVAAAAGVGAVLLLTAVALLLPPSAARYGESVSFGVPAAAFGGAGLLDLGVGVLLAMHLARPTREVRAEGPLPFLGATGAAATAVAFVVIRSLAETSAGGSMPMH